MLDHIILTVSDVERSLKFYTAALKPLKIKMFMPYKGADGHPDLWGFGDGQKAFFWLKQGQPDPASIHWGFIAENNKAVDAFYNAAIAAGAKDNISPRARLEYYPGYYAADVFDPDGYTFEVVHKRFYDPLQLKKKVEDHGLEVLSINSTTLGYFLTAVKSVQK
jgi:catechol 2,3-dioxygenase-like lactoylglutathione lyase family enzyme